MSSSHLRKAVGVLDLENEQRDWIGQFPVELDRARFQHSVKRDSGSMFSVVRYDRPLPIVLPPPSPVETLPTPATHRRSLMRRAKRALSPTLTALFIAYVAVIFVTAWIGVQRSQAARKGAAASQAPVAPDSFDPTNRP